MEFSLSYTIQCALHMDTEMFVTSRRLQTHRVITDLQQNAFQSNYITQIQTKSLQKQFISTHISFAVPNKKIAIVSTLIQQIIAHIPRNTPIIPRLVDEMGFLDHRAMRPFHRRVVNLIVLPLRKRLRQKFGQLLQIVARHQADLTLRVARLIPFRIARRSIQDLEPIALLERQLLLVRRGERVQRYHDVEHILRHRVRVMSVVRVAFLMRIIRGKPAGRLATLTSPPT